MNRNISAICWIMLTGFLAMGINTIARHLALSCDIHAFQLVFFYNILGLLFFLPFVRGSFGTKHDAKNKFYWIRAFLEFAAFSLVFSALSEMPLPMHTALSFTSPLFGSIAAIIILKEKNSLHRWIALMLGFIGVLTVVYVSPEDGSKLSFIDLINPYTWVMLIGAILFAFCGICIKKLTATEPPARIAFYMMLLTSMISFPFALSVWTPIPLEIAPFLIILGMLVAGVQYSVSKAFSNGDVTLILPFFFINLVWSSIFSFIFFDELLRVQTLYGAVIIISASAYATIAEKHRTKIISEDDRG